MCNVNDRNNIKLQLLLRDWCLQCNFLFILYAFSVNFAHEDQFILFCILFILYIVSECAVILTD